MELNATYLFEKPFRRFHSAEPWWTAYFTMLVLWGEAKSRPIVLTSYRADERGDLSKYGTVSFSGATYGNVVADARLYGEPFGLDEWPNEYLHLRPDVTYIKSHEQRRVIFVETKTIGASVQGNVELYGKLVEFLRQAGWSVELYYLLSVGHEETKDWFSLAEASANIITWEDVFVSAVGSPFEELFGEPLSKYVR